MGELRKKVREGDGEETGEKKYDDGWMDDTGDEWQREDETETGASLTIRGRQKLFRGSHANGLGFCDACRKFGRDGN